MRLGFFGGSFDPPHRGHFAVAEAARQSYRLDRVLLAPVAVQPLKDKGGHASFAERLRMVALLCRGRPDLVPCDLDAPQPDGAPNYTIDTLHRLQEQFKDAQIFSVVGLDAFRNFRRWRMPEELLRAAEWVVVSRPGNSFEDLATLALSAEQQQHVHWLPSVHVPISATDIRGRLAAGESCEEFLDETVLAYIRERHLYGT